MRTSLGLVLVGILAAVGCATAQQPDVGNGGTQKSGTPDDTNASADDGGASSPTDDGGSQPTTDGGTTPSQGPSGALASDMGVQEIAVFQAVKIDVVAKGAKVGARNASIVAGRDALVRVYVQPASGYGARPLTAELTLVNDGKSQVLTDTKTLTGASTDGQLSSTFDFDVPGAALADTTQFSVAVRDPAQPAVAGQTGPAQYPQSGAPESLGVESSGAQLKIMVVPVQYAADGSNRLPDTSAAQLEAYRRMVYALYPTAKVEISVRSPWSYTSDIAASGTGFSQVLQALQTLRQQDNAPDDLYYYGALAPAASFDSYCGGGCVTGLSSVGDDPSDSFVRASVGIGYTGQESAITMAHEVGHAHGRAHSPCGGAAGPDPNYPYTNGGIGVWGYNLVTKQLIDVGQGKDIMGYCQPEWISDYTYQALFDRIQFVNGAKEIVGQLAAPQAYRYVNVEADGTVGWGDAIMLRARPAGEEHTIRWVGADGTVLQTATGHYYGYDHLAGGFVLVPEGPTAAARVEISGLSGRAVTRLAR